MQTLAILKWSQRLNGLLCQALRWISRVYQFIIKCLHLLGGWLEYIRTWGDVCDSHMDIPPWLTLYFSVRWQCLKLKSKDKTVASHSKQTFSNSRFPFISIILLVLRDIYNNPSPSPQYYENHAHVHPLILSIFSGDSATQFRSYLHIFIQKNVQYSRPLFTQHGSMNSVIYFDFIFS